jgi:hypothetical protein
MPKAITHFDQIPIQDVLKIVEQENAKNAARKGSSEIVENPVVISSEETGANEKVN